MSRRRVRSWSGSAVVLGVAVLLSAGSVRGDVAFSYGALSDPIVSATFSVDFAALTAHRRVLGEEVNWTQLWDVNTGLGPLDLSEDLFGTAEFPLDPAALALGPLQTQVVTAAIDPGFFPALASGEVGLWALFTDTDDGLFALDFISLTIETTVGTVESFYGWPVGDENNGYGLTPPVADNGMLPDELPYSLPVGATGTGFDETISSKSIFAVPEAGSVMLLLAGGLAGLAGRRSR